MSGHEIPRADLDRLVQIGAKTHQYTRRDLESKLGASLWEIIDLERGDTSRPCTSDREIDYSTMQSREAQIGSNLSAGLTFMANKRFVDQDKVDWLPRVSRAVLSLYVFANDLPHTEDHKEQSKFIIRPKYVVAEAGLAEYRDAPHNLTLGSPEFTQLVVPDIGTTLRVLDAIAEQYPKPAA